MTTVYAIVHKDYDSYRIIVTVTNVEDAIRINTELSELDDNDSGSYSIEDIEISEDGPTYQRVYRAFVFRGTYADNRKITINQVETVIVGKGLSFETLPEGIVDNPIHVSVSERIVDVWGFDKEAVMEAFNKAVMIPRETL